MTIKEPFEGLKVLDFSWVAVGPMSIRFLADYGATVVRVESINTPDPIRTSPPFKDNVAGINRGGFFIQYHPNKYSIALNMKHPKGAEIARKLAAWADVVAESFTPGTMEKYGLGYEDLRKMKPDIIMYRTCNQGQTGPHSKHPGLGAQLVGLSGFTHLTGWPDREPTQPFGAYTDWASLCFGAIILLAALDYRRQTGKGQCIDLSQLEASLHAITPLILDYQANGRDGKRMGNASPRAAPHGAYRCQGDDRWCTIAIFNDDEWQAFCEVIGNPDWTKEARFSTLLGRKENEEELNRLVEEWTANYPPEEVMTSLQASGVPSGVVADGRDLYEDPQLWHRQAFWMMDHKEIGAYPHLGQPFNLSESTAIPKMPTACLGEHTEYVCKEILGLPEEEFVELLIDGVFE
ncbi:CaiB/BaiF CoA transferase family protein [Chloroflexota bacterium]